MSSMSITDDEFHREVEALKSHRRHSVNRPVLDPDLPDLAAVYGGGQELLAADRERRGYNLVDDGQVASGSPSTSFTESDPQSLNSGRSQFTARRRARGSQRTSSQASHSFPAHQLPDLTSSASSASSGRRSPGSASLSPKDPSHLFWVPASVHPEISPSDFRNFLRDHAARAVNQHAGDEGEVLTDDVLPSAHDSPIAQRLHSVRQQQQDGHDFHSSLVSRATSLSRRGSTLRRQYRPEHDTEDSHEDKTVQPLQRNRSGLSAAAGHAGHIPNLTISDLQRLEAAAEEASQTQNPEMLLTVLQSAMTGTDPVTLDIVDAIPAEPSQDPDAPIIVPKPGQILRRAARTKIRKASGDSTPRASLASRRRGTTGGDLDAASEGGRAWEIRRNSAEGMERRHSGNSEISSGAEEESSAGHSSSRPTSAEAADAHSRDSYQSDTSQRTSMTSYGDTASDSGGQLASSDRSEALSPRRTPTQDTIVAKKHGYFDIDDESANAPTPQSLTPSSGDIVSSPQHSPVEERGSVAHAPVAISPLPLQSRRVQPQPPVSARVEAPAPVEANLASTPILTYQQQPALTPTKQKEKDKKSGFGLSWFGLGKDDDEERMKAEKGVLRKKEKYEKRERKEREREEKDREESSSSSFLGALFGKKKSSDDNMHATAQRPMQGHLTAGSLLERNELALQGKYGYYYSRYPIHVERAVYRLSHIKLANPRRPLHEQVLISNLMFWYLSIINRNNEQQAAPQQKQLVVEDKIAAASKPAQTSQNVGAIIDTSSAYDGLESSYADGDADSQNGCPVTATNSSNNSTPVKTKRTGLVKPNRAPAGANRGRAETPMKQPGYGMQHRQIDNDFKTLASPTNHGNAGFVVGQVVDTHTIQANTPYRLALPSESADRSDDLARADYLGLGTQFDSSEAYRSETSHVDSALNAHSTSDYRADTDGNSQWRGTQANNVGLQRSSSPNKPYRTEAEKERMWLGARNGSGRSSPNGTNGVYAPQEHAVEYSNTSGQDGHENQPQSRSVSMGDSSMMQRSGSDPWKSGAIVERRRKISTGSMSHSSSAQSMRSSVPLFDPVMERGMSTSSSTPTMEGHAHSQYQHRSPTREKAPSGHVSLPITSGSSAMLEAARSSQSRRR